MSEADERTKTQKERLVSLDVFRGTTIAAMILVNNPGSWQYVYPPFRHAEWHGWTFTDLIFPFFLFIVGVAIVFAFSKAMNSEVPRSALYKKIVRRTVVLFVLGLFLSGYPYFDLSSLRIMGVLQRIAICYLVAAVIFLNSGWKAQLGWTFGFLFLYWGLMEWIPVPGVGAGHYEKGANLSNYIDSIVLKGHMWSVTKTWDPEGLLSTIPAVSTTLAGVLTGHWLKSDRSPMEKTVGMLILGNIAFFIGSVWHHWLPVNKNIWTSSYAVLMAGLALICLGISYYFIDLRRNRRFLQPALVYGMNAITVFVLSGVIAKSLYLIRVGDGTGETTALSAWIYQNLFASWLGNFPGSLAYAVAFIIVMYLFMLILYRKNIFIKV